MRKTLRIIAVTAGIVSAVATALLGYIYVEDTFTHIKSVKDKVQNRFAERFDTEEDEM
jgi:hypothetical protein